MQHLRNSPTSTLYWIQLKRLKPIYELHSDVDLFCTLQWGTYITPNPTSVVSADGQWTLIADYWRRIVHIESLDGTAIAVCKIPWFDYSAVIEFSNGLRLRWDMNYGRSEGAFCDGDTDILLSFKVTSIWPLKLKARVDMAQGIKDLPEASLLAALGLYFLIFDWGHLPFRKGL
jgi:hypothetical protein